MASVPPSGPPAARIGFTDFWPGFDAEDNPVVRLLREHLAITVDQTDPDYLFFSCFGESHRTTRFDRAVKIFITGENVAPDFNACDYAVSFEKLDYGDRHVRFPLYAGTDEALTLADRPPVDRSFLAGRQRFCNFVYSNSRFSSPERAAFFEALNRRRAVASAGQFLSNHTAVDALFPGVGPREAKMRFLATCRFTIAFENSEHPGYATEKISDAFAARTIPIYWGDPDATEEFNPDAFVDVRAHASLEAAADRVIAIDDDPDATLAMLNAPVFRRGHDRVAELRRQYEAFLIAILTRPPEDARRRPRHGHLALREARRRRGLIRRVLRAVRSP